MIVLCSNSLRSETSHNRSGGDYQSQKVRLQQRKTRKQKRRDRLKIFQEQFEPLESEESLGRQELIQDQRNDSTPDYARKAVQQGQQNFEIDGGVLFKVENPDGDEEPVKRLVVPKNRRTNLLSLVHSSPFSAHLGRKRTLERLNRRFYWPRNEYRCQTVTTRMCSVSKR